MRKTRCFFESGKIETFDETGDWVSNGLLAIKEREEKKMPMITPHHPMGVKGTFEINKDGILEAILIPKESEEK